MSLLKTLLAALGLTQAASGSATSVVTIAGINGDRYLSPLNGTGTWNGLPLYAYIEYLCA
jgi:hypothetical protein